MKSINVCFILRIKRILWHNWTLCLWRWTR